MYPIIASSIRLTMIYDVILVWHLDKSNSCEWWIMQRKRQIGNRFSNSDTDLGPRLFTKWVNSIKKDMHQHFILMQCWWRLTILYYISLNQTKLKFFLYQKSEDYLVVYEILLVTYNTTIFSIINYNHLADYTTMQKKFPSSKHLQKIVMSVAYGSL